jgi:hypothetical protein
MARITFSAILSDARGKVGDVVFSSWRGRPYVRPRVTPSNPNTEDQQTVRNWMRIVVSWWHYLTTDLKLGIAAYAAPQAYSGFNGFTKRCMADLNATPTPLDARMVPLNTDVPPMGTLDVNPGIAPGGMTVTWVDPASDPADEVEMYACPTVDGELTGVLEQQITARPLASAETYEFTGLTPDGTYRIAAMVRRPGVPVGYGPASWSEEQTAAGE